MDDCIEYKGYISKEGYGRQRRNGVLHMAHRLAYIETFGPIEDDLVVDHLCFNRKCINVKHLSLKTRKENSRTHRPDCACNVHRDKTTCKRGHDLTQQSNLCSDGRCRPCKRTRDLKYVTKKRKADEVLC